MPDEIGLSESETAEFELMRSGGEPEPTPTPTPTPAPTPTPTPTASAEQTPTPTPTPSPAPEPKKTERLVPYDALHEERERRKALERQLAERAKPPAPAPSDDIDETQDPIGAIAKLKAEIRQSKEREEEQKRVQEQLSEVEQRVGTRIQAYAAEHPEYADQMRFLRQSRAQELKLLRRTDAQIVQQIQQEEMVLGIEALNNDWDPGELIAQLAVHRGWKPKEAEPQPTPTPTPSSKAETEKLERLERGQRAATSSSNGGGGGPEPEMTMERLLSLDGAALLSAFEKHGKRLMA